MKLKDLIGSGDKIMLFTLPFIIITILINIRIPSFFSIGQASIVLRIVSFVILILGILIWIWCVVLILFKVSKNELIRKGPYSLIKHPLYTNMAFLVLPWIGFLLNSWLGLLFGIIVYSGSRIFSPQEEKKLSQAFGVAWYEYRKKVKIPWL